jgi:hypothetical protein
MTKERKNFDIRERESAPLDVLYQRGQRKKNFNTMGKKGRRFGKGERHRASIDEREGGSDGQGERKLQ